MDRDQLDIAREAMIEWLANPQELGKRPSKIVCAGNFEYNKMRYYIFKFKTGLFGEWLLGVCGGFEEGDLEPCGHIFSDLKKYNEATAQSECIAMVEKIIEYWKEQAKKSYMTEEVKTHNLGGCIITKSLLEGKSKLKWLYREQGCDEIDTGWRAIGDSDTEEYIRITENNVVVDFDSLVEIEPAVLSIYLLPVGTELEFEGDRKVFIDTNEGKEYR